MCFSDTGEYFEIICASNGFFLYEAQGWVNYSNGGLPVWAVHSVESETGDIIVIMGDGSYSDGIYLFDFETGEFSILYWIMNPHFLVKCETNGYYYVGGEEGLLVSEDGLDWENVEYFNNINCEAMAYYEEHLIVSANNSYLYYSDNSGQDWYESESYVWISDMVFDFNERLYGIFPDMSWSSGLWSSDDYGVIWEVEFWDTMMSSVCIDFGGLVFVGWEEPSTNEGIAVWTPDIWDLTFFNDGLPNLYINKITFHPYIDCINIIACTDGGVYLLTGYEVEAEDKIVPTNEITLYNYPNPFNPAVAGSGRSPTTTVYFSIPEDSKVNLSIYDIKGQKVKTLTDSKFEKGLHKLFWDSKDSNGRTVSSGIYFYQLKTKDKELTRKMLLMK